MKLGELDALIRSVCPIDGINSDGEIWFRPDATDDQKALALALMNQHLPELLLY